MKKCLAGPKKFQKYVEKIAEDIIKRYEHIDELVLIGIETGGSPLTKRLEILLKEKGNFKIKVGFLDITLYRDDWTNIFTQPKLKKTKIPFSIENEIIILVDDVLFTGRTVRAALDALIDLGRPKKIDLAVLVDRPGRELPICPDFVGLKVKKISPAEYVNVYFKEIHGKDQILIEGP